MQLHFVIDYRCELKAQGRDAFVADLTPLAMWRDLDAGLSPFDDWASLESAAGGSAEQSGKELRSLSEVAEGASLEGVRVALPRLALLENDPVNGQVSGAQLLARARRAIGRAEVCRRCPAAAVNPSRFGCWTTLALPGSPALANWTLARWSEGRRLAGSSGQLCRLVRLRGHRGAACRALFPPDKRSARHRAKRSAWRASGGVREELSADALFAFLINAGVLKWKHQIALLRDFAAADQQSLDRLEELRREAESAPANWEAPPFLLQPEAKDSSEIVAFKAVLHLCYWAAHMGRRVFVRPVFLGTEAEGPEHDA
jgi:hypothetical protein